jgi:23S rRNA (guanosine2251-2'-O)-methyltransferase
VVVFGNEEYGISSHVMPMVDDIVHIPMFGRKNSLNVANAVAVILFQIALSASSKN